jgi:hypothetical protein
MVATVAASNGAARRTRIMRYFKVYNDQSGLDLGIFCGR